MRLTLKIEPEEAMEKGALTEVSKKLSEKLKMKTNLTFKIKLVSPGDLPRYTLKSMRFKDLRG